MRRAGVSVLLLVVLAALVPALRATRAGATEASPFAGLGTWVDVFDYTPRLQHNGAKPPFTAPSVDDAAALGVRTLYVQVANPDTDPPSRLTDRRVLQPILDRAHRRGLRVVAWYLPSLADRSRDASMLRRIAALRADGRALDGYALDLESSDVADVAERSTSAVAVTRQARKVLGSAPLAAIVYPAVQLEVLNTKLWPSFPYRAIARSVDAWIPMVYATLRDAPWRVPRAYADESVRLLRAHIGKAATAVHLVGGIADATTPDDVVSLHQAVGDTGAVGWSLYDFATTSSSLWPYLRGRT